MGRNLFGGKRHKKQAKKNFNPAQHVVITRLKDPKEDCEMYAIITAMYGQGNCEALCNDGKKRLCIIRKKFRARNRRNNQVLIGTRVLVGLRDWELLAKHKKLKCDLLEVYLPKQIGDLKKDPNYNSRILKPTEELYTKQDSDVFTFADVISAAPIDETGPVSENQNELDELEWFDIDDI